MFLATSRREIFQIFRTFERRVAFTLETGIVNCPPFSNSTQVKSPQFTFSLSPSRYFLAYPNSPKNVFLSRYERNSGHTRALRSKRNKERERGTWNFERSMDKNVENGTEVGKLVIGTGETEMVRKWKINFHGYGRTNARSISRQGD